MCEYCKKESFETIIENEIHVHANNVWGSIVVYKEPEIEDVSVVIDIREDCGFIRLGDRHEMQCIDHSKNFKINYCPMCGRKL